MVSVLRLAWSFDLLLLLVELPASTLFLFLGQEEPSAAWGKQGYQLVKNIREPEKQPATRAAPLGNPLFWFLFFFAAVCPGFFFLSLSVVLSILVQ